LAINSFINPWVDLGLQVQINKRKTETYCGIRHGVLTILVAAHEEKKLPLLGKGKNDDPRACEYSLVSNMCD